MRATHPKLVEQVVDDVSLENLDPKLLRQLFGLFGHRYIKRKNACILLGLCRSGRQAGTQRW